jgi:hypothetical protein
MAICSTLVFEGRAGSGFFSEVLNLNESFALGAFTSVFQTEIHANLACSDDCLKKCVSGKKIYICSDSRAAS